MNENDRVKLTSDIGGFGGLEFIPAESEGVITAKHKMPGGVYTVDVKFDNYDKPRMFLLSDNPEYLAIVKI
jgi:hypothetical protein